MAIFSLALACLALLAFLYKTLYRQQPKQNLPPGPKPWPIIGNLNLVGPIPHQSLHFLSQKYGEIMQLKFGTLPVVVAPSPEMAKQFLRVHDTTFASRPALSAGKYTSYNYSDLTWAPYGLYWRQTRKIYSMEIFNARKIESFEHIRVEEGRNFLSRLRSLSGKPVVLRDHLSRFSISSISRMVFGNKYFTEFEDEKAIMKVPELRQMLDEWLFLGGVFNFGDWTPWLSSLDLQGYVKRMKALAKKLDRFYNFVLDDHLTRKAARADFIPEDVLDSLLQLAEDSNLETKLTREHVKALAQISSTFIPRAHLPSHIRAATTWIVDELSTITTPLWNTDICAFSPQSQSSGRETDKVSGNESRDGLRHWATKTKRSFLGLGTTSVLDAELGVLVPVPVLFVEGKRGKGGSRGRGRPGGRGG
ncbi:Flavonoid 3'-monooxygenase [Sesamum alatum]|uniref:Flavonoid 3'-monooxygenase n=1 Tax=Sesamum alatum TaxID=300844 RepID=A0AAE1XKJ1_9LAMI|nr:Flavonoid 3'-monooxygenase [Sesamum alatum]